MGGWMNVWLGRCVEGWMIGRWLARQSGGWLDG